MSESNHQSPLVTVTVDDANYQMREGENLLQALLKQGLELPYFCWHPALEVAGSCRQCALMVYQDEADTRGRLMMACTLTARDGLRIALEAPPAKEFRSGVVEMLMTNHPHDCPVCEEAGECHLQDMTMLNGHVNRRYPGTKRTHRNQQLGPFINHEMNRCIACYRCQRFYQDYAGGRDLTVFSSRNQVYFGRYEDGTLESNFSGNLVEICPTGVFTDKSFSEIYKRKWDLRYAPSICGHCSLGCNTTPGEYDHRVRRIQNRYHGAVNGHFLCDLGRFAGRFNNSERRTEAARIDQHPVTIGEGITQLQQLLDKYQGQLLGVGSPRANIEANFVLQDLVGHQHFHPGLADEQLPLVARVTRLYHDFGPAASLADIECADHLLVVGEDIGQSAPRLMLAARQIGSGPRPRIAQTAVAGNEFEADAELSFFGAPAAQATWLTQLQRAIEQQQSLEPSWQTWCDDWLNAERPVVISGTSHDSPALLDALHGLVGAVNTARQARDKAPLTLALVTEDCNTLGVSQLCPQPPRPLMEMVDDYQPKLLVILETDLHRHFSTQQIATLRQQVEAWVVLDTLESETGRLADLQLATTSLVESNGTLVNYEGRLQRHIAVHDVSDRRLPAWQWLNRASLPADAQPDNSELARQLARSWPHWQPITGLWPHNAADFRLARQPHRASSRCAEHANISVHEPRPPAPQDDPYSFSMEASAAPAQIPVRQLDEDPLMPDRLGSESSMPPPTACAGAQPAAPLAFTWQPGWNSLQGQLQRDQQPHDVFLAIQCPSTPAALPAEPAPAGDELLLVRLRRLYCSDELSQASPPIARRATGRQLLISDALAERLQLPGDQPITLQLPGGPLSVAWQRDPRLADQVIALADGPGSDGRPLRPWPRVIKAVALSAETDPDQLTGANNDH